MKIENLLLKNVYSPVNIQISQAYTGAAAAAAVAAAHAFVIVWRTVDSGPAAVSA